MLFVALVAPPLVAAPAAPPPDERVLSLTIDIGPIPGVPSTSKTVGLDRTVRRNATWYDVQDGLEHNVRGMTLKALLATVGVPKGADTVMFTFVDGMQIPVHLRDAEEVNAIFVAQEHGDPNDVFEETYTLRGRAPLRCPKVVYGRETMKYSIWLYPTDLARIGLVNWKAYESALAQPTRQQPDRSGWPIYLRHCQPCHGIGGQGAKRGSDFLSHMDAYRRVPPLAETDPRRHPSLHEKVKGFVEGQMPTLNHISNREIATLWRWLHTIHAGATR
jgi:hypothetical protein